ncbi:cell division protein ZipA [Alkalilimnicola sp. S0819]|uniref:cell division protein ZipA n=1 Tax=Alkalilimnicola sp. S0819 TaxID=2613922 RepID=UPI00126265EB|nr:cell division protein ZipA [Alkalilimnicola sp. S0819]KAB7628457.1 cell division protein ZipA [Alkalilimnicola sp. S0819]MPQ15364.1 cell division protein ZipA [Alkalilimnicola sp. S0819]
MDSLRWILLIIGLLLVAAVFLYGWQQERRRRGGGQGRRRARSGREREPDFDAALDELDSLIVEENGGPEPRLGDTPAPEPMPPAREPAPREFAPEAEHAPEPDIELPPEAPEERPDRAASAAPAQQLAKLREGLRERLKRPAREEPAPEVQGPGEKIVVINVSAGEDALFHGRALTEALERAGLRFGEHEIYHRVLDTRDGPMALFSAANMVEPGTFSPDSLEELYTPGAAFFMQLPGPFDGLTAFEQMLEAARGVAEELGGYLLDARRCDLSRQAIEHMREDLREYRRLAHLAARKSR